MRTSLRAFAAAAAGALLATGSLALAGAPAGAQGGSPPMIEFLMVKILSPSALNVVTEIGPGGAATTAFVRYGETPAYGLASAHQAVGSGLAPVKVTFELTGLHRSTTYHLQIVATNAAGKSASPDTTVEMPASTFTPSSPSPTPPPAPYAPVGNADQVRAVPASNAQAAFTSLNAVSCTSATFCLAVGTSGSSPTHWRPLVERFGGRAFNVLASPTPWGAQLTGVACRSAQFCLAVGGEGNNALSERWNGKGWRVLSTPSPRLVGSDLLFQVTCTSETDCLSVGIENGGTRDAIPLVERWNGAKWSILATPTLAAPVLESLSCPSATNCWAVGIKDSASGLGHPLAEHWNGRAFVASPMPSIGGRLYSVSCGAPGSCIAVGAKVGNVLVMELSGGSWHVGPGPREANFNAAACTSTSNCLAVGGVTARWNGHSWALGRQPVAYGAPTRTGSGAELQGLSCPTSQECIAVGGLIHLTQTGSRGGSQAIADVITG